MTPTTQDPISRFTSRIEELRHVPGLHGLALLVHNLMFDVFMSMIRLFAALAERARNRTLPDTTPAPHAGASPRPTAAPDQPRVRPPGLRPRRRHTMHALSEQPDEPPARLPPPPRARVRAAKNKSTPAPARPRHVDDGRSRQPRGPALLWTAGAGFLRFDSKKSVSGAGDSCVYFVTI
jgi:hypothetical protein